MEQQKISQQENQVDISEKYNLMEIRLEKIEEKTPHDNELNKGLLYGMVIAYRLVGSNNEECQTYVSDLSKYNHPSLSLVYGFAIDKDTNSVNIIREWVSGHCFIDKELFNKDAHDRLVLLYKIICLFEFLHSFEISYNFLTPNKVIVTVDMDIKVIDLIKIDYTVLNKLKSGKYNTQLNFLHPKVFENDFIIDKKTFIKEFDIYSIGCLIYFAITQSIPFASATNLEELITAKSGKLESFQDGNEELKAAYEIASKCLSGEIDSVEKLKEEFCKLPDVDDFIKNETINFNYNEGKLMINN
jgi:serine/threonine protein kinase